MVLIPFCVIIPLGCAFIISLLGKRIRWFSDILANIAAFSLLIVAFALLYFTKGGVLVYKVGNHLPPIGISMVADSLTVFMLVTVNLVAFLITVYSIDYMKKYTAKWKFYTLFMLMLAGINGVIITGDLFNLFVFLEIASIASYALVAFGTEAEELEASFKYAVMGSVGASFLLLGIAFLYSYTSTLNMADMASALLQKGPGKVVPFVTVLFLMGFGLKAALVPFHAWLPDAHPSAPAPISAMLSGVLIKVLGAYALARIFFNVFVMSASVSASLMFLGALSMIVGVILAVGQWDFKRLLAYHSISQIGYVILGIFLGTPLGIFGGLFHLFNHSIFKSLLFLNSGAVVYSIGTRDLKEMGGLKERMPVTAGTDMIASMSIAGIPPLNGFFSKLIIIFACIQADHPVYAFWAVLGSLLTLASFVKVQKYAFFGALNEKWKNAKEVPPAMLISMIILALICVISALLVLPAFSNFIRSAANVLLSGKEYARLVSEALK